MCETRYDAVQEVEVLVRDCQTCTCPTSPTDHNWQQINGEWVCTRGNHS